MTDTRATKIDPDLWNFLGSMLNEFSMRGWGQPATLMELGPSGLQRMEVSEPTGRPYELVSTFRTGHDAVALLLHYEIWPDASALEENSNAEIFRILLWVDTQANHQAVACGSSSHDQFLVSTEFRPELEHLSSLLTTDREVNGGSF